ncbi:hypothetical protein TWF730_010225 [Orbilia blumenaviensis]|uniref:Transmembrane protein n=1 Tax=Orbilia blumenaviensis TaxID=1796055 RepID=A0AAV9UMN6_9PEZI
MGLYISRKIIDMETARAAARADRSDAKSVEEVDQIFHKSKALRVCLGIGAVFQACIGSFCMGFLVFEAARGYSNQFSLEILRIFGFLYAIGLLWNTTIWFLCVYYNRPLPRNKQFIIMELARLIPWMIVAVGFFVIGVPEIIDTIYRIANGSYYGTYLWQMIAACVMVTVGIGPALWALVRMFIYFIKERKEEILEALNINQEKECTCHKATRGTTTTNGADQNVAERERTANSSDRDEEPLLIDHDQMV